MNTDISHETRLNHEQVRWRCIADDLSFLWTDELTPKHEILGQEDAVEALRFGLESRSHGNNIFVRGLSGFGH